MVWQYTLHETLETSKTPVEIMTWFSSPENIVSLNPDGWVSGRLVGEFPMANGCTRRHLNMTESMKVCGIPYFTFSFDAMCIMNPAKGTLSFTTDTMGTHVEHQYSFQSAAVGGKTVVHVVDDVVISKAPLCMGWYVLRVAKHAHKNTLSQLAIRFGQDDFNEEPTKKLK
eukprot:scaffold379898_cov60-Attheya_sp.AAC.1